MTMQPNRRSALKTAAALAAGLFAVPAVKAALIQVGRWELELERWEEERFGALAPRRRSQEQGLALLLPCWREVADAADAVLRLHECDTLAADPAYEDECIWLDEMEGVKFLPERSTSCWRARRRLSGRPSKPRRPAGARRPTAAHDGCPVLWCWRALCRAGEALGEVLDGHAGPDWWLTGYARRQLWGLSFMTAVMRDAAHLHVNSEEAHLAYMADD